jgi:hypothetical protein
MAEEKVINIEELAQDTHNFNKGTDEGRALMERSLNELGAGRSILIDKDNNIIAGNKTQEAAIKAGIKKVRIIETTGDELVAVKRTDVDIDSARGRELALVDNLSTQVNLSWDETEIETIDTQIEGFDVDDWGFEMPGHEDEKPKKEPKTEVLRPFNTNHVLISYPIDLHDRIMQLIEELREEERIEIEQSAN